MGNLGIEAFFFYCHSGQKEKDAKPLPRINRHSIFWIVASVGVTYYVDFFHNIIENEDIKRWSQEKFYFFGIWAINYLYISL